MRYLQRRTNLAGSASNPVAAVCSPAISAMRTPTLQDQLTRSRLALQKGTTEPVPMAIVGSRIDLRSISGPALACSGDPAQRGPRVVIRRQPRPPETADGPNPRSRE